MFSSGTTSNTTTNRVKLHREIESFLQTKKMGFSDGATILESKTASALENEQLGLENRAQTSDVTSAGDMAYSQTGLYTGPKEDIEGGGIRAVHHMTAIGETRKGIEVGLCDSSDAYACGVFVNEDGKVSIGTRAIPAQALVVDGSIVCDSVMYYDASGNTHEFGQTQSNRQSA
jgi:hypothetical protein